MSYDRETVMPKGAVDDFADTVTLLSEDLYKMQTDPALRQLLPLCEKGGARPVLYMTWAEKAKPRNAAPMIDCCRSLAERCGTLLAPVGELFERFRGTDIELYWQDGEHASPYGSWLLALTFAALLCDTRELDAVSSRGFDFRADYGGECRLPRAEEDPAREEIVLDATKTARIRAAVAGARLRKTGIPAKKPQPELGKAHKSREKSKNALTFLPGFFTIIVIPRPAREIWEGRKS